MLKRFGTLLSVFSLFAACGGSGGSPQVDPPPEPQFITVPATVISGPNQLIYNASNDTTQVASNIYANSGVTGLAAGINTYRIDALTTSTTPGLAYMVRGVAPSGNATAMVRGNSGSEFRIERLADALLPTNGTLVYANGGEVFSPTPNYTGVYQRNRNGSASWGHMTGSATLRVQLDTGEAQVSIFRRMNTAGAEAEDVRFNLTPIDVDAFSATGALAAEVADFSGGQFETDNRGGVRSGGAFAGLVSSDDGEELIGTARFTVSTTDEGGTPVTHIEYGVFSAERCSFCADG